MKKTSLLTLFLLMAIVVSASRHTRNHQKIKGPPPPCHSVSLTGTNASCYGMNNGSATYLINRAGTYKVIWSGTVVFASTTTLSHTFSNLAAGYYDIQVIDLVSGCSAFDIINILQPLPLVTSITVQHVKCHNHASGMINLSISGGNSGFQYTWSSGQHTQDLSNVMAGNYQVTVTDNKSCMAIDSARILQPAQALGQSLTSMPPSCYGYLNAWIDLTVWGGTTPYTYSWNNSSASQDLDSLPAGNYEVLIKDANDCSLGTSVSLINPSLLTSAISHADNLCHGDSLGSIDVTPNGGTSPYSFSWANSAYLLAWTTEDLTGLPNDSWYVTVTDAHGCTVEDSASIQSPEKLLSSITSTNVTSFGGINGSITMSVSGGLVPYTFSWSNGGTSQNLSGIPAGWYHVVITDANLCTRHDSAYISEPLAPLAIHFNTTDILCFGASSGKIVASGSGGTPPYTFSWSTGSTSTEIGGLSAGTYTLTITDFYGNTESDTAQVIQPDAFGFNFTVTNVSCHGLSDGSIDLQVQGGTPPYSYVWMNSNYVLAAITEDITGMPADQYYLMITDTFSCKGNISIGITQPEVLSILIEHTDAYCAGSATGTASCTITGGTSPYQYLWSGGGQTAAIHQLPAGMYAITVTDNKHCLVSDSIQILEADSIRIEFDVSAVSCRDQHDGRIHLDVTGGNGGYTYLWNTLASSPELSNLEAGLYQVTVTDLMGCTAEESIVVPKLDIDCISIPSCFTPNNDGVNDTWVIKNAYLYPEFFLDVYNRWGQVVHGQKGSYEPWDSYFQGKPLPSETYYYFLRITSKSPVIQGTITIIR